MNAYVEGTVGWVSDKAKLQLTNGREIPLRVTTVFHKENGEWKLVQHHASVGVPNSELIDKELTLK